ncbi:MAG: hypothetical protein ACTTJH_07235 [Bacteroidales bacterium]
MKHSKESTIKFVISLQAIMANELLKYLTSDEQKQLANCKLCPRRCGTNRWENQMGFCNTNVDLAIALIINHKGEEPILSKNKGITNVFFSHCNCQCIFCQNHRISSNKSTPKNLYSTINDAIEKIIYTLKTSENILGFVSATHQLPIMKAIIRELHRRNVHPKIVYNCGGYESVETLRDLENIVNIYLPDWKYANNSLGMKYSCAPNYPQIATASIKEMYRQKGSSILTDKNENIENGLIIRHLILPNEIENSKKVLDNIAWELSPNVTLSLMSQYKPPFLQPFNNLNRKINEKEYNEVLEFALALGFHKIYTQDLSSPDNVLPDFDNNTFIRNH